MFYNLVQNQPVMDQSNIAPELEDSSTKTKEIGEEVERCVNP